jgi:hypothetical protein
MRQKTIKNFKFSVFSPKFHGPSPGFKPGHTDYLTHAGGFMGENLKKIINMGKYSRWLKKLSF